MRMKCGKFSLSWPGMDANRNQKSKNELMHLMRRGIFRCCFCCESSVHWLVDCLPAATHCLVTQNILSWMWVAHGSHHTRAIRQRCEVACGLFVFIPHLNHVLRALAATE